MLSSKRTPWCTALVVLTLSAVSFSSRAVHAQDAEDRRAYSAVVVQERAFQPTHEFHAGGGILPLDAFTKGVTVGGGYTLHFSHLIGWEVLQGSFSFKRDTDLADELEVYDLRPSPFEVLDWFVTSNLVYKPLYWKGAWRNEKLVRGETFFMLGGAFASYTRSRRPGVNAGMGTRLFLSEHWSLRFDARYMWFFGDNLLEEFDVKDELWLGLGASLTF